MENYIPEFREREWEWKIAFPTFGNENEKIIPKLWEREWEAGIPGNGWEREFPLTPDLRGVGPVGCPVAAALRPSLTSPDPTPSLTNQPW